MIRAGLQIYAVLLPVLFGSDVSAAEVSRVRYLMGTLCEIRAFGPGDSEINKALTAAFDEISRLERVMSTYRHDSEVSRINKNAFFRPQACSPDLWKVISLSRHFAGLTDGAFDITVGPLLRLWGVQDQGNLPGGDEIAAVLSSVGNRHLQLEPPGTVRFLKPAMALDFGGIGKGYALDRAADVLRKHGIKSAFLNFGGNILALGAPITGEAWEVEVPDPLEPEKVLFKLHIADASVSTSSQFERSKSVNGRRIGHILDPRSGKPVEFWGSVTVIAPAATEADAFSTPMAVMGPEKGVALMEKQKEGAVFYLLPSDSGWNLRASSRCVRYGLSPVKIRRKQKWTKS